MDTTQGWMGLRLPVVAVQGEIPISVVFRWAGSSILTVKTTAYDVWDSVDPPGNWAYSSTVRNSASTFRGPPHRLPI